MGKGELKKVEKEFNFYRDPECHAEIIDAGEDEIKVEFSGTVASYACCFDENFIDFQFYVLDFVGEEIEVKEIKREKSDKFIVTYSRKRQKEVKNVHSR